MWRTVFGLILLSQYIQPVLAEETKKPPASKEEVDAYSHGYMMGRGLYYLDQGISLDKFLEGITDGFNKSPKYLDEERIKIQNRNYKQLRKQIKFQEKKTKMDTNRAFERKFLETNKSKEGVVALPSGLQYKIIKRGAGALPRLANFVAVRYKGYLPGGHVFDAILDDQEPAVFKIQHVIKGWQEALKLMPEGSAWKIFVPSKLAYGQKGSPPDIEPNQMLIFDIELIGIQKKDANS